MAMNMEAVLRIAAKTVGLDEITKLEKAIGGAEKAAQDASSAFKAVANSSIWQAAAAGAAVFMGGMALATKAAIDFESSMSDVRKVVSGIETPEAFAEISAEILQLSNQMPIAAKGFAEIYAAAGQSGIARGELKDFATLVAQVSVAFDMTAQEAGQSLAQMKVALGLTTPEVRDLADAMNYVSNNTGATAGNLVEFMSRSGAVGKLAGLTATQTTAFGAAMIQAGIQTEVASTSFNNMIKALSRGPSMTEKQVEALRRLGYSMADAAKIESELSKAAERESRNRVDAARRQRDDIVRLAQEQSDRRIEVARDETDRLAKEINRRYRNEQQALQDNWDDQAKAQEDALQNRTDALIKGLQRQERAEIEHAQKMAKDWGADSDAAVERIRDAYQSRIDAVRDQLDRELTVQRRAQRDQQQVIRDALDDRKELELSANNDRIKQVEKQEESFMQGQKAAADGRFKAIEDAERDFVDRSKANAKKTGEELAKASTQGFADRLQEDAIGTITEVLGKIRDLPKSQQVSVLSDLFGDEARGLAPMIANLDELTRIIGLASDETGRANSVTQEYGVRVATAAAQIQLFWNQLQNTAIVIGTTVLPALSQATQVVEALIKGLASFAKANPGITALAVAIGGVVFALVLALPVIASFITAVATIKTALAGLTIGATIAGWAGAVGPAVAGITAALGGLLSWIGATLIPGLLAFFSGPVGWTVLVVAAVVAMAIAFREPLLQFIAWLWEWGEPIRKFWSGLWDGVAKLASTSLDTVTKGFKAWGAEVKKIWSGDFSTLEKVVDTWRTNVQKIWTAIGDFFQDNLVKPMSDVWTDFVNALPHAMEAAANVIKSVFRGALQNIVSGINTVISGLNYMIRAFNAASAAVGGIQFSEIGFVPIPQFAQGGVVDRPTLALVGEGGEQEYVVPESKMQQASARYLAGARGADVIPRSAAPAAAPAAAGSPTINITTGPVLEFNGERYVRVEDLQRAMRVTADGVLGRLRTPASRRALGIA